MYDFKRMEAFYFADRMRWVHTWENKDKIKDLVISESASYNRNIQQ